MRWPERMLRWFRKPKPNVPPLKDDVMKAIDAICERNMTYRHYSPIEIGFIKARRWTIPLSEEQESNMKIALESSCRK